MVITITQISDFKEVILMMNKVYSDFHSSSYDTNTLSRCILEISEPILNQPEGSSDLKQYSSVAVSLVDLNKQEQDSETAHKKPMVHTLRKLARDTALRIFFPNGRMLRRNIYESLEFSVEIKV